MMAERIIKEFCNVKEVLANTIFGLLKKKIEWNPTQNWK